MEITNCKIKGSFFVTIKNKYDSIYGYDYFLDNWIHYYPNQLLKTDAWYSVEPILKWHTENETDISSEVIEILFSNSVPVKHEEEMNNQEIILIPL